MPVENERKYPLDDPDGALERRLAAMDGVRRFLVRQAYLDAPGVRLRAFENDEGTQHVFGYKRTVDGVTVDIETEIPADDFRRLWTLRRESLTKVRLSWTDDPFVWDVDFFKTEEGATYFALAEVEMPESATQPPSPPSVLAPHVLMLADAGDPRFTSKALADRDHAVRLLADLRTRFGRA